MVEGIQTKRKDFDTCIVIYWFVYFVCVSHKFYSCRSMKHGQVWVYLINSTNVVTWNLAKCEYSSQILLTSSHEKWPSISRPHKFYSCYPMKHGQLGVNLINSTNVVSWKLAKCEYSSQILLMLSHGTWPSVSRSHKFYSWWHMKHGQV